MNSSHKELISGSLLLVCLLVQPVFALENLEAGELDWHQINQEVSMALLKGADNELLKEANRKSPAKMLLMKLNLSVRKGDRKLTLSSIDELSRLKSAVSVRTLSDVADFLIGKELWTESRAFLETSPEAEPGWGYVFVKGWLAEQKESQKSLNQIDLWLKTQTGLQSNRARNYWVKERLRFANDNGFAAAVLNEYKNLAQTKASKNSVETYLAAASMEPQKADYSFLTAAYMPDSAFEKFKLGTQLCSCAPLQASIYLQASLDTAFSKGDSAKVEQELLKFSSLYFHKLDREQLLRRWTKESLAESLRKSGNALAAQKVLLELSNNADKMPTYALTLAAGQIQLQTPQTPLEKMIKKAEPENKNNQEYWLGRARYYQGRKEDQNVLAAYDAALALSKEKTFDKRIAAQRRQVVDQYCLYLRQTSRADKAAAFYFNELDRAGSQYYRAAIIDSIWHADSHLLKADDERLWDFLSKEKDWDYSEQHILQSMLASESGVKKRGAFWDRAEKLANQDPSRQAALGFLMDRNGAAARSIPLLKAALFATKDKDKQALIRNTLFEAYLDNGDWKQAEQIWNSGELALTGGEIPEWLVYIAVAAAKAGAKEDAFRLWKKKDRIDRSYLGSLEKLSELGLKRELIDYYQTMAKSNPSSTVPAQALKVLR